MDGGGTVTGKSLAANAQETLEASKVTAIKKRPFNGISSKLTDSPVLFTEVLLSNQGLIARKYDTAEAPRSQRPSDAQVNRLP